MPHRCNLSTLRCLSQRGGWSAIWQVSCQVSCHDHVAPRSTTIGKCPLRAGVWSWVKRGIYGLHRRRNSSIEYVRISYSRVSAGGRHDVLGFLLTRNRVRPGAICLGMDSAEKRAPVVWLGTSNHMMVEEVRSAVRLHALIIGFSSWMLD